MTKHTTMTVVSSPVSWFVPGDEYERGDIAAWMEDGSLPVGLVLRNGTEWRAVRANSARDWRVERGPHGLVLRRDAETVNADGVRLLRRSSGARSGTRLCVLAAVRDLGQRRPPSYRELAAAVGCVPSLARYHVAVLSAEGLLDREPYQRRALWLTEAGERLLQEGAE